MATKPTNTYRWAQESGGTKHNIVEPSSGHKDEGWIPGRGAIAQFFNWLNNGAHEWILYLKDAVFVGEAGQPGVTATGGTGNTAGGVLTGVGTGNGATITGGATGKGAVVAAGGGNNVGLESTGTGSSAGVVGTGGSSAGSGVEGTGGTNGIGVKGSSIGAGDGVRGTGTSTGPAVAGSHTGAGPSISADSSAGSGYGVSSQGNATRAPLRLVPQGEPSTPLEGDLYVNSTDHKLYLYNGTSWVVVGTQT